LPWNGLVHCSVACCSETRSKIEDEFDCSTFVGGKTKALKKWIKPTRPLNLFVNLSLWIGWIYDFPTAT
jgi:hypothetical protein